MSKKLNFVSEFYKSSLKNSLIWFLFTQIERVKRVQTSNVKWRRWQVFRRCCCSFTAPKNSLAFRIEMFPGRYVFNRIFPLIKWKVCMSGIFAHITWLSFELNIRFHNSEKNSQTFHIEIFNFVTSLFPILNVKWSVYWGIKEVLTYKLPFFHI